MSDATRAGRVILDTSVLIGEAGPRNPSAAISAASLAELHFGVLVARDPDEQARRNQRLAVIEAAFESLPLDAAVAREWGRLAAAVVNRGGRPRRRAMDLAIAATANVHGAPLVTTDRQSFAVISDLVDVRIHRLVGEPPVAPRVAVDDEQAPWLQDQLPVVAVDRGVGPPAILDQPVFPDVEHHSPFACLDDGMGSPVGGGHHPSRLGCA